MSRQVSPAPVAAASSVAGDAHAVVASSIPFLVGGFGILELPIRWGSGSSYSGAVSGLVLSCYGLGYGLAQVPSSIVTQRLGSVPTLRLALLSVLAWPLTLASSAAVIATGRFLFGLLAGLTFSAGLMLLRQHVTAGRQAVAAAAFSSSWAVGLVAAALVGDSTPATAVLLTCMLALGMLALAGPAPLFRSPRGPSPSDDHDPHLLPRRGGPRDADRRPRGADGAGGADDVGAARG